MGFSNKIEQYPTENESQLMTMLPETAGEPEYSKHEQVVMFQGRNGCHICHAYATISVTIAGLETLMKGFEV
jgi:hypothetical protein